jgi:excisionase family DNA binding protein
LRALRLQDSLPHPTLQAPAPTAPLLLTPAQAAAALNISRSYLYILLASGQLESLKCGRLRRVRPEALAAWIERTRAEQAAEDLP